MKKNKESLPSFDGMHQNNVCIMGILEEDKKEKGAENLLKK